MAGYLARRLAGSLVLLVVVVVVTFALVRLAPGDAALTLAGPGGADPEYLAALRHRLGLDRSLQYQVGVYLAAVLRGDLGFSVIQGSPVLGVILGRLPATLLLACTSLVLATVAGVVLGAVAAARRGTRWDTTIFMVSLLGHSLPVFWVGQLLVGFLAVRLNWLPAGGIGSVPSPQSPPAQLLDVARHLVLPTAALTLLMLGLVVRTTRAAMIDVLAQDYITVGRAFGASERRVLFRHALPNALRPVVTVVANNAGLVLTGTILVETVFAWPGLGRLVLDAVLARDTPVLVGLLLFSSFVVSVSNLAADLAYAVLDPKVRYW